MKKVFLIVFSLLTINVLMSQHRDMHAYFDASATSYIDLGKGSSIPKINNLSGNSKLTIALWVKWDNKNAAGVSGWANLITLADSTGSGDNGVFWVQHSQDNKKFEFAIMSTQGNTTTRSYLQSTTQPTEGNWYHLACVYDGDLNNNNLKIYVNGVLETTQTKKGNIRAITSASKLNIGRWANPTDNYRRFNGSMDEIFIFNNALSSTQINSLMNSADDFAASTTKASSLISYYNFENNDASDFASSPNNGKVYSGVSFIGSDASNLPIELVQFTVENNNSSIQFSWTTSSEINNNFFTIEKSYNGIDFETVANVQGAGNSNQTLNYSYEYTENSTGIIYFRLKQTDFDGRFTDSKIINLSIENSINPLVYPNPVVQGSNFKASALTSDISEIQIYSLSGKLILALNIENTSEVNISTSEFKQGTYIIKFITNKTIISQLLSIN